MTTQFKAGDTVRLKSGGPLMTIAGIGFVEDRRCSCQWFNGQTLYSGDFYPEALTHEAKDSARVWQMY